MSWTRAGAAACLGLLAGLLTACGGLGAAAPAVPATPPPAAGPGTPPGVPAGAQRAVVERHIDGDTLALVGVGEGPLPAGRSTRVRLLEVDTPEVSPAECFGREASAFTARALPVGSTAWVAADRELTDRYERTLLYAWAGGGAFHNEELVRQGYARAVRYRPNDRYLPQLRAAQAEARAAPRGLRSGCPTPP